MFGKEFVGKEKVVRVTQDFIIKGGEISFGVTNT